MKKRRREKLFSVTEKDFKFQEKRGSGKGGQKKNKTSSGIQCFHKPSGAMGECTESRKQSDNKKIAFQKCVKSVEFQTWAKLKAAAMMGQVEIQESNEYGQKVTRKVKGDEI